VCAQESVPEEVFRLSPQQRRLWRIREQHPEQAFGVQCLAEIRGPLDVPRLDQAIQDLRRRYEILRTRFALLAGSSVPVQVVNGPCSGLDGTSQVHDLRPDQRELAIRQAAQEAWDALHRSHRAPGVTFVLLAGSDQEHWLLVTASGLCADAATLSNLICELKDGYDSRHRPGEEIHQYADLAEWQNQILDEAASDDQESYWRTPEFLDLASPQLPLERRQTEAGENRRFETMVRPVSEITPSLRALAKRLGVPPQAVLLSAWAVLLHRVSRMERFLIGTEADGRSQAELSKVVGPLSKLLPLSATVEANTPFTTFVSRMNTALTTAQLDQFLYSWGPLGPGDGSNDSCLPTILFSYRVFARLGGGPLNWEIKLLVERLEPCQLELAAVEAPDGAQLEFRWDSGFFARRDIEVMADCYVALLGEISSDPDCRIDQFSLKSASHPSILAKRRPSHDSFCPIHEAIEQQAARLQGRPAVVCGNEQVTYAELDARAAALSVRLRPFCQRADSVVAIIAQRSIGFFVGMLAVLKAGAAWLPIEPDTPSKRIQYMMEQAHAVAVMMHRDAGVELDANKVPRVYLDESLESDGMPASQAPRRVHPEQLAYMIFTSGSTGQPKGVAIEHRHIAAYMEGLAAITDWPEEPRCALVSTIAADLGHSSVFPALMWGGCLHVIPPWQALDGDALAEYFLKHPVDFVKIVPSHLEALCRSFPKSTRLPWRCVMTGGEVLQWKLVESLRRVAPDCTLLNEYGPTETTVGVFCDVVDAEAEPFIGSNVSIGDVFPGTSAYLLDDHLEPVQLWTAGELYIGGAFVGRGYAGASGLTGERFLPDPICGAPGQRMYRTGDLARLRSDGKVEFLGRRDAQVKIRGYRVELQEVEAALSSHPQVHNCAAVLVKDSSGGNQIVVWAAVGQATVLPDDLRAFLGKSLPHYMIPSTIICVDKLKLNANGKVDRQALPAEAPAQAKGDVFAPLDETESLLLSVWQEILGLEQIGVEDNYFALGGDSLRVIQLVHQARRYGIVISTTDVLRYQTIRKLRNALRAKNHHSLFPNGLPPLMALPPEIASALPPDVVDCYPASGIQLYILEEYLRNKGSFSVYHIQEHVRMSDESFSLAAFEAAFQAVVNRHPSMRTVFNMETRPAMQWVRRHIPWQVRIEDISHLAPGEQDQHVSAALRADRARHFDIRDREAPLFRVAVCLRSVSEFDLLFSCHHAILDGWGHRVLMNQLVETYLKIKSGERPSLGEPDETYRQFVAYQQAVRDSEKAAAFWQDYLAGLGAPSFAGSPSPDLEPDEPGVLRELSPAMAQRLIKLARSKAVSLQALLLAAWLDALREWENRTVVGTGVIANGRSEHLTDPLSAVGLFWNIVPVVSRSPMAFPDLVSAVHRDLIEMEPYSAYPYPQLLADRGGREMVSTTFRYLHFWNARQTPEHSGLKMLDTQAYDCYAFPLNCVVLFSSDSNNAVVILQYDPAAVEPARAQDAMDCYIRLLEKAVAEQGDQLDPSSST
jgi:amino acid adenylation domain-containing protein